MLLVEGGVQGLHLYKLEVVIKEHGRTTIKQTADLDPLCNQLDFTRSTGGCVVLHLF